MFHFEEKRCLISPYAHVFANAIFSNVPHGRIFNICGLSLFCILDAFTCSFFSHHHNSLFSRSNIFALPIVSHDHFSQVHYFVLSSPYYFAFQHTIFIFSYFQYFQLLIFLMFIFLQTQLFRKCGMFVFRISVYFQ